MLVKTGRNQIKIIPHANDIRVRIVGKNNGVLVSAITIVGHPRAPAEKGRRKRLEGELEGVEGVGASGERQCRNNDQNDNKIEIHLRSIPVAVMEGDSCLQFLGT